MLKADVLIVGGGPAGSAAALRRRGDRCWGGGVRHRKALRALQLPIPTIARAIAEKDLDTLRSLPEIGKRTAETIVLELHDKVAIDEGIDSLAQEVTAPGASRDAIQVLVQLGEPRIRAVELVDRAGRADPDIETPDALVAAALRLKEV